MNQMNTPIRIVVPAFNAERTILPCVQAIIHATRYFATWELVVVDNGSNADLANVLRQTPAQIIHARELSSAAYARNEGVQTFKNGIIIFIDSDVVVEIESLYHLVQPILNKQAIATIGNYSKDVTDLSFAQSYKQLYIHHMYQQKSQLVQNDFWTAISAVDAQAFQSLQGFDTTFKGANGEDQEFGIRLTTAGYKIMSTSRAIGKHLNPYTLNKIIRNDYRKGLTAMSNSLVNDVPLSDNRHAKVRSIVSVMLATFIPFYFLLSLLFNLPLSLTALFVLLWVVFRLNLIQCFAENKGIVFLMKSIFLIYTLDVVRFACVVVGYKNHWTTRKLTSR
jgi:glycosyltransferase involved in cell wall biosynthesis